MMKFHEKKRLLLLPIDVYFKYILTKQKNNIPRYILPMPKISLLPSPGIG